jgi:hypothetical protein
MARQHPRTIAYLRVSTREQDVAKKGGGKELYNFSDSLVLGSHHGGFTQKQT